MKALTFLFLMTLCLRLEASDVPVSATKNQCKAYQPLSAEKMESAESIFQYFKENSSTLKTVEDKVCCLPKEYLENYVVGIASDAGQNGIPNGPRVIMFDRSKSADPPKFMISFNGGKSHNTQPDNLEIAQYNKRTHELELYDLDVKGKGRLTGKNPTQCLICHGEPVLGSNGKITHRTPFGGPKFIFDVFENWKRFAGGLGACGGVKEESLLHNKLADRAIEVIKTDSRYRCLDKGLLEIQNDKFVPKVRYPKLFQALSNFDNDNISQEIRREITWIRHLPEFEKYKYFLLGFDYCKSLNLEEWFPPDIAKRLYDKVKIDPQLKIPGSLKANFSRALQQEWKNNLATRASEIKEADHPNFDSVFTPNNSALQCDAEIPKLSDFESNFSHGTISDLQHLDETLHQQAFPDMISIPYRVFLDGEGYTTAMISTIVGSNNSQLVRTLIRGPFDLSYESKDSKLKKLFREVKVGLPNRSLHTEYQPISGSARTCIELKRLSKEQFSSSSIDKKFDRSSSLGSH